MKAPQTLGIALLSISACAWSACSSDQPGQASPDGSSAGKVSGDAGSGGRDGDSEAAAGLATGGTGVDQGVAPSAGGETESMAEGGEGGTPGSGGSSANAGSGGGSLGVRGHICPPESLYEPNDSAGSACWILPNSPVASALVGDDIDDYYSIDLVKGVTYTLDLVSSNAFNRGITLTVDGKIEPLISVRLCVQWHVPLGVYAECQRPSELQSQRQYAIPLRDLGRSARARR